MTTVREKPSSVQSIALLGFIVFINMAGLGLAIPVMPSLLADIGSFHVEEAAKIGGWLMFSYAAMQFLFAPVIAGLSDRFGRRPILLLSLLLLGIDYALMAWAPTLGWLFIGRLLSGAMGASSLIANSSLADSVSADRRGHAFGILGACSAAGFVFGPLIGGLAGQFGIRAPFLLASFLAFSAAILCACCFRETLAPSRRRKFSPMRSNPVGGLIRFGCTSNLRGCLAAIFLAQLAAQSQLSVWSYFGVHRFGWGPPTIGFTVAFFGMMLIFVQGVLVGRLHSLIGAKRTALLGLTFTIPSYMLIAFAPSTGWIIIGLLFGSLAALAFPSIQSLMTKSVGVSEQGELQGAIASIMGLTAMIGPPLMTWLFAHFSDSLGAHLPGAPFILASCLSSASLALLLYTFVSWRS
jgi:DHA1 family tetracycline resistance protein-like MFS transporter